MILIQCPNFITVNIPPPSVIIIEIINIPKLQGWVCNFGALNVKVESTFTPDFEGVF